MDTSKLGDLLSRCREANDPELALKLLRDPYAWQAFPALASDIIANTIDYKTYFPFIQINCVLSGGRHFLMTLLVKIVGPYEVTRYDNFLNGCPINAVLDHHYSIRTPHTAFLPRIPNYAFCNPKTSRHVFLYRDPRDVLISKHEYLRAHRWHSHYSYPSYKASLLDLMHNGWSSLPFRRFCSDIGEFYEDANSFKVSYEKLALAPEQTLKGLIEYLGFPFDLAAIREAIDTTPRTGKIGQWVSHFDSEVESTFKEMSGDLVSRLGYELDETWSHREYGNSPLTESEYLNTKRRPLLGSIKI